MVTESLPSREVPTRGTAPPTAESTTAESTTADSTTAKSTTAVQKSPIQINETPSPTSLISSKLVAKSVDLHGTDRFPQGCQFSPDNLCILTSSCDKLLLYNVQLSQTGCVDWKAALRCETGDVVRSYSWYPYMNSAEPSSCCFVATSRDQPVHLYDAYTGAIRATYSPYNGLDELESPSVVTFAPDGQKIIMGGFHTDRMIQTFDLSTPGRYAADILKLGKTRHSKDGQKGLVSSVSVCPYNPHLLAIGTYSPGSIYLYDDRCAMTTSCDNGTSAVMIASDESSTCVVGHGKSHGRKRKRIYIDYDNTIDNEEQLDLFSNAKVQWFQSRARGGVTQLEFSPSLDHYRLYSASRRSDAILAWDLRRLSSLSSSSPEQQRGGNRSGICPGIATFETDNDTNQRIEFAIDESHLWVGGCDRRVRIYNASTGTLVGTIDDMEDVVNGVSLSSKAPLSSSRTGRSTLLAVASGSRRFPSEQELDNDDDDDDDEEDVAVQESAAPPGFVRLYQVDFAV